MVFGHMDGREPTKREKRVAVYSATEEMVDTKGINEGSVGELAPMSSQSVRVFISSTFSDMCAERNALMEVAYPELKEYCRQYNLEFQAYDLRWGIRDHSIDDHSIVEFCLKEAENCEKYSVGPSMVAFIGQKYGYRPFPTTIVSREFKHIMEALGSCLQTTNNTSSTNISRQDLQMLETWYLEDTNVTPQVYRLQPISSILINYKSEDEQLKNEAKKQWDKIAKDIIRLLRLGADRCLEMFSFNQAERDQYFASVTEFELEQGIFKNKQPDKNCLCFFRTIKGLDSTHLSHPSAFRYIDCTPEGQLDVEAQKLLKTLKETKIKKILTSPDNVESFDVKWSDTTVDPNTSAEYLDRFCRVFVQKMKNLIDKSIVYTQISTYDVNQLDIIQHVYAAQQKGKDCRGREEVLGKIKKYLTSSLAGKPLVLYGESGCGKSAIIAKAFLECQKWFPPDGPVRPVVIARFFGTTTLSCDIRLALSCICWQISEVYCDDLEEKFLVPGDYSRLAIYFNEMLKLATRDRPLILLLDSLDQLSTSHRAHNLAWLPHSLPQHVHVIVTTLPDPVLTSLKRLLCLTQNFVNIPPLDSHLSVEIVKDWLVANSRSLTSEQFDTVERAFKSSPVPLYTVLVSKEVIRWSSYAQGCDLASTCQEIISRLFERIEIYYGFILVKHLLSYITASKNGLSSAELEDILSLDDVVLGDVFQHWVPPILRIPPLLLCRIRDELSNYLVEKEANGSPVIYWYHSQFIKVAKQRYLSDLVFFRYVHSLMGHYYLGTWSSGKKKPLDAAVLMATFDEQKSPGDAKNRSALRDADRMVARQPLCFEQFDKDQTLLTRTYNLRKLAELPHHLMHAKMFFYLRNHVLFNYDWIHAKITATSLHDLLTDYQDAAETGVSLRDDPELQLLGAALRVGGVKLDEHPNSLGFELLGRLMNFYDEHSKMVLLSDSSSSLGVPASEAARPISPHSNRKLGDSSCLDYGSVLNTQCSFLEAANEANRRRVKTFRHSNLLSLLQQCDNRSIQHSALLPVHQCFEPPDMMILYVLDGHSGPPSDILFVPSTNELITVSKKEILFWDLTSCGTMTRRINLPGFSDSRAASAGPRENQFKASGSNRIYVNRDQTKLVVSNDAVDTPILVYDLESGRYERQCGSKQANSKRSFLAGNNVFCQQNTFYNICTGKYLSAMSDFVKSKNVKACTMSKDASLLVVGVEGHVKVFDFLTRKLLCQMPGRGEPSTIVVGQSNSMVYVGYADTCLFSACAISRSRGSPNMKPKFNFDFKKKLPASELDKHKFSRPEIKDIVLPSTSHVSNDLSIDEISHQVLINIDRISLVLLSTADESRWVLMKTDFLETDNVRGRQQLIAKDYGLESVSQKSHNDFLIRWPAFSGNCQFVLAAIGNRLCIWDRETGDVLRAVAFHTHSKFHAIAADKHLAVTTSTLNGVVRVWDLRAAKQTQMSSANLIANCGPARIVCCARNAMVAFIGNSYSTVNLLGIKKPDYYGIDVLDLNDGTRRTILNYGKYGTLLKMKTDPDGRFLALLLTTVNKNSQYIAILDVHETGDLFTFMEHKYCRNFEIAADWSWLATEASNCVITEVILWHVRDPRDNSKSENRQKNEEYARFLDATCPRFFLDCERFAFISASDKSVNIYFLTTRELCARIEGEDICDIKVLPGRRDCLLVSSLTSDQKALNSVWNISTRSKTFPDFESTQKGIIDTSKDGRIGLDADLNVYDLVQNGRVINSFKNKTQASERPGYSRRTRRGTLGSDYLGSLETAQITYDGRFILWTEKNQLKAGRVKDGKVVGSAYLHERPSYLELLDSGYLQVVGGENGHLFVVRLVAGDSEMDETQIANVFNPRSLKDRQTYLLDRHDSLRQKGKDEENSWKMIDVFYGGLAEFESKAGTGCPNGSKPAIKKKPKLAEKPRSPVTPQAPTTRPLPLRISTCAIEWLKQKADVPITELGGITKHLQSSGSHVEVRGVTGCTSTLDRTKRASRSKSPSKNKLGQRRAWMKSPAGSPRPELYVINQLAKNTLKIHSLAARGLPKT